METYRFSLGPLEYLHSIRSEELLDPVITLVFLLGEVLDIARLSRAEGWRLSKSKPRLAVRLLSETLYRLLKGADEDSIIPKDKTLLVIAANGRQYRLATVLQSVFGHAVSNAADAYLQEYESDISAGKAVPDMCLQFYVYETEKDIHILMANNGVPLTESETSAEKKAKRALGVPRRGGGGLGIVTAREHLEAMIPGSTTWLWDRAWLLKDRSGAVFDLQIPRANTSRLILSDYEIKPKRKS